MNCRKMILLFAVLLFSTGVFAAQTQPAIIIPGKTMQKILQLFEKKFEKSVVEQRRQQAENDEAAQPAAAPQDSVAKAKRAKEVCAETGHSHQQAKNHKGPCMWIDLSAKEETAKSQHGYNPKTGEHIFIHANGTVWKWKEPKRKPDTAANGSATPDSSATATPKKLPAYW